MNEDQKKNKKRAGYTPKKRTHRKMSGHSSARSSGRTLKKQACKSAAASTNGKRKQNNIEEKQLQTYFVTLIYLLF